VTIVEIFVGIFEGFRVTATVTALGVLFAVPFALIFGVAQYLTKGVARLAVTAIIEFWRSSAVIILLFVFYYVLPVIGIHLAAITVSAMVLGLNTGDMEAKPSELVSSPSIGASSKPLQPSGYHVGTSST
jgi:polar amino acid transport system permease protein